MNPEAKQRVLNTLKTMYEMGEGTVARALVVAITQQQAPINIKLKPRTPPSTKPGEQIARQPGESSTIYLDPDDPTFGADWAMKDFPAEKPPADLRGAVVVLAHELGHVLDGLRLTDAKDLDGKVPYAAGTNPVYGANVLLENEVRKEVAASKLPSLRQGGRPDLKQRPAYAGAPYDASTRIAGEEFDRLNRFLDPLGKSLPRSKGIIPEGQYRDNRVKRP